jgi:transposase
MIRSLRVARVTAVKARTQASNALKALLVTAPVDLREQLGGRSAATLVRQAAGLRPGPLDDPTAAAKLALRILARRHQALSAEIATLNTELDRLVAKAAPGLVTRFGVGPTAPARCWSPPGTTRAGSAQTPALRCYAVPPRSRRPPARPPATAPDRGGDRQAGAALYRIVVVRLRWHQPTKDYMARRLKQGKTTKEIIRCLKRYVARELFTVLNQTVPTPAT